jgi:hypothetical protein
MGSKDYFFLYVLMDDSFHAQSYSLPMPSLSRSSKDFSTLFHCHVLGILCVRHSFHLTGRKVT